MYNNIWKTLTALDLDSVVHRVSNQYSDGPIFGQLL